MEKRDIKLHELKYYYDTRHGFVFESNMKSKDDSIDRACEALKNSGITDSLPEFMVEYNNSLVFVYPEKANFKSGPFFEIVSQFNMMGMWNVDILNSWLKQQND